MLGLVLIGTEVNFAVIDSRFAVQIRRYSARNIRIIAYVYARRSTLQAIIFVRRVYKLRVRVYTVICVYSSIASDVVRVKRVISVIAVTKRNRAASVISVYLMSTCCSGITPNDAVFESRIAGVIVAGNSATIGCRIFRNGAVNETRTAFVVAANAATVAIVSRIIRYIAIIESRTAEVFTINTTTVVATTHPIGRNDAVVESRTAGVAAVGSATVVYRRIVRNNAVIENRITVDVAANAATVACFVA